MAWCHVPGTDCPSAQAAEAWIWASCSPSPDFTPAPLSNGKTGPAPSSSLPLTQSLNSLSGTWGNKWFLQAAGTFISIIVPLLVFFGLQRFFVRGLLAGATKG